MDARVDYLRQESKKAFGRYEIAPALISYGSTAFWVGGAILVWLFQVLSTFYFRIFGGIMVIYVLSGPFAFWYGLYGYFHYWKKYKRLMKELGTLVPATHICPNCQKGLQAENTVRCVYCGDKLSNKKSNRLLPLLRP